MSPFEREPVDPELERGLEHVEPPRARGAYRAELRRRFVHADAARDEAGLAPALARRAPRPATASRRRGWTAAAALVAAGLVLVLFLVRDGDAPDGDELVGDATVSPRAPTSDPAPDTPAPSASAGVWTVLAAPASIAVDGSSIDTADTAALERALSGAKRISTQAGVLRLRLADLMLVELGPASEIVLAGCTRLPPEGAGRALEALAGAVRIATGPDFDGLSVATPDLELSLTGTALAVDVDEQGTCVCCSEGTVEIEDRASPCDHALRAGEMAFVHRAGVQSCLDGPAVPDHAAPLAELMAAAAAIW